jgi:hypothetical protein
MIAHEGELGWGFPAVWLQYREYASSISKCVSGKEEGPVIESYVVTRPKAALQPPALYLWYVDSSFGCNSVSTSI